jgi:hypothetical protein
MLAANGAVTSIVNGGAGKSEIWSINSEDEYHEEIGVHSQLQPATQRQ